MKRVLIADDTKNIRSLLTTCLEVEGYDVVTAKDGQEALNILKNDRLDLAFIDIKMPIISGTEVLREIRGLGILTPVIIITAFATIKNAVECTKLGAVQYIQKPFTANRVKSVLDEVIKEQNKMKMINKNNILKELNILIDKKEYNKALLELKKNADKFGEEQLYSLYSKIYDLIGNKTMSERFAKLCSLFSNNDIDST